MHILFHFFDDLMYTYEKNEIKYVNIISKKSRIKKLKLSFSLLTENM